MYLSIHINYLSDSRYSGPQVFYNESDKDLALSIQESLNSSIKSDRNAKLIRQNYYMYRQLTVPGVLIECGFISNANERKLLQDKEHQERLATAITDGIIDYYAKKKD